MSNTIVEQLKELKNIEPRQEWVASQRELLMSQISNQMSVKKQSFFVNIWFLTKSIMPTNIVRFIAQPIGVITLIGVFIFSSGAFGVNAAKNSLPGDFLYSIKQTSEKVQMGLTTNDKDKATLHVKFAEERVREIDNIIKNKENQNIQKEKIMIAVDSLKDDLKKAQEKIDQVNIASVKPNEVVEIARDIDQRVEILSDRIGQQKIDSADVEIVSKLSEAERLTEETSVKAVEVIIEKHAKGEVEMSSAELMKTVEKKLNKAEEKANQAKDEVTSAAEGLKNIENEVQIVIPNQVTSSSPEATAPKTQIQNIQDKSAESIQILQQAKNLLDQGDLTQAIEKIKQSTEITTSVKVSVDDIRSQTVNISNNENTENTVEPDKPVSPDEVNFAAPKN